MEIGLLLSLGIIALLIFMSALFSASETALTGVSKARLHNLEKEGSERAAMVNMILKRKDRMIGAMLLGNNFINTLASAIMTSSFIALFGPVGVFYATFVVTILVLIFAEVLPKTYALHHPDELSMRMAPLMRAVIFIFSPITETVAWIVRGALRLFGVDISRVSAGAHLELLRGAIEMHEGPEKETAEQRAMLRSVLDLFDVFVEDIMIHRKNVTMIDGDQTIEKIVGEVLSSPYTRLPIWRGDQDNIIGVIHAKKLLKWMHEHQGSAVDIRIEDVLAEPWFVPETTSLFDQLQAFRERREHFAIVVDEYGSFMGIVTLEDILEEIVGEIDDEQDVNVPGVRRVHDGSYLVDGSVTIRDLNREFDWDLPDEEYSTIAGLVLYEAEAIPEVGQSFIFHDCRFDVVRRHRNQITMLRVRPLHLREGVPG